MAVGCKENDLIKDRYRLIRLIGRGGFSKVWLALDEYTESEVVLKVYTPDKGLDHKSANQFLMEFRCTRDLRHPNLLVPDHFDLLDKNQPMLVMPFCPNGSLSDFLCYSTLKEHELAKIMVQVGNALAQLHERGIVHQDIKPANILIDNQGNFLLTDFGISRQIGTSWDQATPFNPFLTMAYTAPERFTHQLMSTAASDIFSLGVLLYELATGITPWDGLGGAVLNGGAEIPDLPKKFSRELNVILHCCLELQFKKRPTAKILVTLGQHFLKFKEWPLSILPEISEKADDTLEIHGPELAYKVGSESLNKSCHVPYGQPLLVNRFKEIGAIVMFFFFLIFGISSYLSLAKEDFFETTANETVIEKPNASKGHGVIVSPKFGTAVDIDDGTDRPRLRTVADNNIKSGKKGDQGQ